MKTTARLRRKMSVRRRIQSDVDRPRLMVFRSTKHIYAQVIDDTRRHTIAAASSLEPEIKTAIKDLKKTASAKQVGLEIARRCLSAGITKVVFDRSGFVYHGRIAALADGAREGGLNF